MFDPRDENLAKQASKPPDPEHDFADKPTDVARRIGGAKHTTGANASASTSAAELAERIHGRSCAESARALRHAYNHLVECRTEACVDGKATQVNDLALLPSHGTAFFFSDLEGNIEDLVSAIAEHKLLERIRANDPDDQVFLCVLGDSVDRSRSSSVLMEFLLELKCNPEFTRNIIILSGNHELSMSIQSFSDVPYDHRRRLCFRNEILTARESYAFPDLNSHDIKAVAQLCYEPRFSDYRPFECTPSSIEDQAHEARVGMWLLFNDIFQVLPKMIVSGNGLCAFHAGFPAREHFADSLENASSLTIEEKYQTLMEIASITDTSPERSSCHPFNALLDDITWSDIDPTLDDPNGTTLIGNNKRGPDGSPGPGMAWGHRALLQFSEISGTTLVIRGHQHNPPEHPDVERMRHGAWRYKNCVTINSSPEGGLFVSLNLATTAPTPHDLKYHTPLIEL